MSSRENPLDLVLMTYETTKDCLKIADKVRFQGNVALMKRTKLILLPEAEATDQIKACHDETENFAVLSLWAVFERFVVEYLIKKGEPLQDIRPANLAKGIYETFESAVERGRINDTLDLLKEIVDPKLIGNAKNIKKYRDWVAHKNPKRGPMSKTDPKFVHHILSEIIQIINDSDPESDDNTPQLREGTATQ